MKYILLFLVFVYSCSNKLEKRKNLPNPYKENKVKEHFAFEYKYKFGEVDSSSKKLIEHYYYDKQGRDIKRIFYRESYDIDKGYYPDTSVVLFDYSTYERDKTVKTFISNKEKKLILSSKTLFDENDRILEYVNYDESGKVEGKSITKWSGDDEFITYNYDKYGDLTGKLEGSDSYSKTYDKDGKLIAENRLVSDTKNSKTFEIKDSTGTRKNIEKTTDTSHEWYSFDNMGVEKYSGKYKMHKGLAMETITYSKGEPDDFTRYIYIYY